jgi:hypothetical protein
VANHGTMLVYLCGVKAAVFGDDAADSRKILKHGIVYRPRSHRKKCRGDDDLALNAFYSFFNCMWYVRRTYPVSGHRSSQSLVRVKIGVNNVGLATTYFFRLCRVSSIFLLLLARNCKEISLSVYRYRITDV